MWPFTRKPKPIDPGPINEDWRVGDLAECIAGGEWVCANKSAAIGLPELGDVSRVLEVYPDSSVWGDKWWLVLSGWPADAFNAALFRKVPPLNTAASAEFTAQIKALQPAKKSRKVKS